MRGNGNRTPFFDPFCTPEIIDICIEALARLKAYQRTFHKLGHYWISLRWCLKSAPWCWMQSSVLSWTDWHALSMNSCGIAALASSTFSLRCCRVSHLDLLTSLDRTCPQRKHSSGLRILRMDLRKEFLRSSTYFLAIQIFAVTIPWWTSKTRSSLAEHVR